MREMTFEFRDFSCDFVDRPSVSKDSIHEVTRSRTKKPLKSHAVQTWEL